MSAQIMVLGRKLFTLGLKVRRILLSTMAWALGGWLLWSIVFVPNIEGYGVVNDATVAVLGGAHEAPARLAGTIVDADITTDTAWTKAGSPYTLTVGVDVLAPVTLTVEPGVEVRSQGSGLNVYGTLLAVGTVSDPITFTATSPVSGAWDGIYVAGTVTRTNKSVFDYVTIAYGGWYGNLYLRYAEVTLAHSLICDSDEVGMYASTGGVAHISDTHFADNAGYAVYFEDGAVNPVLANLTATGNGYDAVAMDAGTLTGMHMWEAAGIPYILAGGMDVAAGGALTIEPGVEVRSQGSGLNVYGTLLAVGTVSDPITFTATSPVSGAWDGIYVAGTVTRTNKSVFDYVTIAYGGWYGNLYLRYAEVTLAHSLICDSDEDGVYASTGGVVHISDTHFVDNAGYAVYFEDGAVNPALANLTATGNEYDAVAVDAGALKGRHVWEATGLPYVLAGGVDVALGGTLVVAPGVEVRSRGSGLNVYGTLAAIGTASRPITFTATNPVSGAWDGLYIAGSPAQPNEGAVLDYVTVEYGGWYANLYLRDAKAEISNSVLRYSDEDGVYTERSGGSVIALSQIVDNAGYGVQNTSDDLVLAANNWWGDASGPAHATCNPMGKGDRVSEGVEFRPFLSRPDDEPGLFSPADARTWAIAPSRWFAPADGTMRIWVKITLRDGYGRPLPGRTVRLNSTLGTTVDGGMTDIQGQTFAYVTSSTPGEAVLTAHLDFESVCEAATSPAAHVTFMDKADDGLLPGAAAPYMNEGIEITPLPLMRGVPATVRARLTNPNDFPIVVDASFSLMQLGIGLTFGPVGEVDDFRIEANSTSVIAVPWTPVVDGHQCMQLQYTARSVEEGGRAPQWFGSGSAQRNDDVRAGSLGSSRPGSLGSGDDAPGDGDDDAGGSEKPSLQKAKQATGRIGDAQMVLDAVTSPQNIAGFAIPNYLFGKILDFNFNAWGEASKALGGDPPRQDYKTYAIPETFTVTLLTPGADLSAARAAAANALMTATLDLTPKLRAATISLDRYGGAAAAGDQYWASQQAAALIHYKKEAGQAMIEVADRIDAYLQVLRDEGVEDLMISVETVEAYQARLRTEGFNAEDLQAARAIGLTDAEIDAILQKQIAADPEAVAGSVMTKLADVAEVFRTLGDILMHPPNFPSENRVSAKAGTTSPTGTSTGNNLARVFESTVAFPIGNPLSETATVDLRVRRVGLPSAWMVSVDPLSVTLAPGERATATVRIRPARASVQGTQPRVAVEGYISDTLIGGVTLDVLVPSAVFFDGNLRLYLPLILKTGSSPQLSSAPDVAGCEVFPVDNIWNTPVDTLPVHPNSDAYIETIGADRHLHPDFGTFWQDAPIGIPYVVVSGTQPKVPITFDYADESDPGPYPIPPDAPIEGGRDSSGDRHVLVLDRDACVLYELFYAFPQDGGTNWTAGSGAIFDLTSHALRPDGWTSADAAGLPILPGLVRYDEVMEKGEIHHAVRFTAAQTRDAHVWPARHDASSRDAVQYPPMGQRFRLKADYDITGFSPEIQVVLRALKTYGMILADNGSNWYISGQHDARWDDDGLGELKRVPGSAFEAVDVSSLMMDADSGQVAQ